MNYYDSNVQFFTEYNEWLLKQMEKISTDELACIHIGDDIAFKLTDGQGNEFYSASMYDPQYEAEQFLDGINFDNTGYILFGMGSSAIIKQILENKTETAWVLIIEKDPALVKKFFQEVDLSPYLLGKLQRIIILTDLMGDLSALMSHYIFSYIGYYLLQTELLRTFASYRRDSDYYDTVINIIVNQLRTTVTAMGNSMDDTLLGMSNELKNVPIALRSRSIKDLKEKYKGKPIFCVASGPSLDKQLPLLKRAKGKALIISAESAFKVLMKNGIAPDVLCILERGPNSYELSTNGMEIPEETALIALSLMDPRLPRAWNSYVVPIFKANITHSRLMSEALGDMGTLYNGNSVAHLSYSLAQHLGGYPIVFIGQDLAYSEEGVTHSKDSFYVDQNDEQVTDEQRKQLQAALQPDQNFYNKTVYVDGYYGGKVRSRELWRQFLFWMEHMVEALPAPLVINSTEGGADIKGTIKMPFQEVLEKYCQDPTPSIPDLFRELPSQPSDSELYDKMRNMIDFFNERLGEIERISKFAEEILQSIDQLLMEQPFLLEKPVQFLEMKASRIMRNVEHLIKDMLKDPFSMFYLSPLLTNYHVKMNPISRVSSMERLKSILVHQSNFMMWVVEGKDQIMDVYERGIREAVAELELDDKELYFDPKLKWEAPNLEQEEEEV
ncbi:motility associated factor glycosyltransferase family protein [Paenibacillus sp. SI8]|uniref:motility associated factor glycosyltransferase family protein n=1 Tax=unclassified Paenibacillus TaxID=185978 RepID=UPI003466F371